MTAVDLGTKRGAEVLLLEIFVCLRPMYLVHRLYCSSRIIFYSSRLCGGPSYLLAIEHANTSPRGTTEGCGLGYGGALGKLRAIAGYDICATIRQFRTCSTNMIVVRTRVVKCFQVGCGRRPLRYNSAISSGRDGTMVRFPFATPGALSVLVWSRRTIVVCGTYVSFSCFFVV